MTLRFRDARGALVKRIVVPACRVDATLSYTFVCRFAKGTYRVVVSATDSAGNTQTATATTDLRSASRVRRWAGSRQGRTHP